MSTIDIVQLNFNQRQRK